MSQPVVQNVTKLAAEATTTAAKEVLPPLFTWPGLLKNMCLTGSITTVGDYTCQALEHWMDNNKKIDQEITKYQASNPTIDAKTIATLPQFQKESFTNTFINGNWKLNLRRLASVAGFGVFFFGPVGGIWYPALDRVLHTKFPQFKPGSFKFVATKAGLEQVFLGPIYTAAFFPFTTFGEGGGYEDLKNKLKQDYLQTLILDESCWLVLAPLLYGITPVKYQLTFASFLMALEAMLFSYIAHNSFSELPVVGPFADRFFGAPPPPPPTETQKQQTNH